jgi:FkbM family methyltransferase
VEQYFAQYGEDKILDQIFNKSDGTAVEVGGFDGVTGSNTFFFERKGWKTLLVEPNPELIMKIRRARKAAVSECAVGEHDGEISLCIPTGGETLASVATDAWQMRRMQSVGQLTTITVRQRRLDDVLTEAGIDSIDFITIDVEGNEVQALRGFSLERWRPRIIILEDNSSGRSEEVPLYMEQRGYIRFRTTGCNDWYCAKTDPLVTRWGLMRAEGIKALKGFKHIGLCFMRRGIKAI